jgi:type II secretory pathway component PulK
MYTRANHHPLQRRKGVVLLAVLIVVVILTLTAYQFSELMLAEYKAAGSHLRMAQAQAAADSAVHYAAALLSNPDAFTNTLNSNPYDNPSAFQGVLVPGGSTSRFSCRFSVISLPDPDDPPPNQPFLYGVTDETGRINLNALMKLDSSGKVAHDVLMLLPNMTEDVANAILDWIDADDEPRSNGAENDYYQTLPQPYACKNGPLDSVEELLFVKGVTPPLLFGNDYNRNGTLDPDRDDGTGTLDRGWSAYLTVYSRELNLDSSGNPRIWVNDSDLNTLSTKLTTALGSELASYIILYRQYGSASQQSGSGQSGGGSQPAGTAQPSTTGPMGSGSQMGSGMPSQMGGTTSQLGGTMSQMNPTSQQSGSRSGTPSTTNRTTSTPTGSSGVGGGGGSVGGGAAGGGGGGGSGSVAGRLTSSSVNLQQQAQHNIGSLYELINSQVSVPGSGANAQATVYSSPLNDPGQLKTLLPLLLDGCTTTQDTELPARVNVNTAPRSVLGTLPGISEGEVQSILDHRPLTSSTDPPDQIYQTPAWLLTEANFSSQTLQTLEKYITCRAQVYRLQAVGFFENGGPSVRVEAVIDTNGGRPRIIYYRNLTELGKGFDVTAPAP